MTRDEIRQQYFAEKSGASPPPDPTASAITQILQGGLSQPMNRKEMEAAYAPSDPREAYAAGMGSVVGLGDEQRSQALQRAQPNKYLYGQATTGALLAAGPAKVAVKVPGVLWFALRKALQASGVPGAVSDTIKHFVDATKAAQKPAAENQPPPSTGALSAEMKAALKRGKFRHDYSTGEWRDFLAPGE